LKNDLEVSSRASAATRDLHVLSNREKALRAGHKKNTRPVAGVTKEM
jgi:hypothetical protein